jgi:hypothetical protein
MREVDNAREHDGAITPQRVGRSSSPIWFERACR